MRILHIINGLGRGGAERLLSEMLPIINEKEDITINVLVLNDYKGVYIKSLIVNGVGVQTIPLRNLYNPLNVLYIRRYIIEGKYDIVHAHLFPTIYWVSIASKLIFKNKPKFVMTEHSTYNKRRKKSYFRYIEKFIYSSYDKIISISQQTHNNLISWIQPKNKLDRFIIIQNGIVVEKFKNALPYKKSDICKEFTEDVRLICMAGRFSKSKDQQTLIRAMQYLPENVHLLLAGEGPLKKENIKLTKQVKVENRVHFLGFRNDMERILKTVDIVVLSSNWEGFGLAAVEGMAAGKPVIASDVAGLRENVKGAGILFQKGNDKELSEIIKKLFVNKNKYEKVSQLCLERANDFTIEKMVNELMTLYNNILR